MSRDELGVIIRYALPAQETEALARVSRSLGVDADQLVARAVGEWTAAGRPATLPIVWRANNVAAEHAADWTIVCWWLRRSPALELLDPATLFKEARLAELVDRDIARMQVALAQLTRIAHDFAHPRCVEAHRLVLSAIPEPRRSELTARFVNTVAALSRRGAGSGAKA